MSFCARTHPQQGPNEQVDDREITDDDFDPIAHRFGFTVDAAASPHNAKVGTFWTKDDCGLVHTWAGHRVWCNPPYSNIRPWVEKAATFRADIAVLLLPANRTEQAWWQDIIEPLQRVGLVRVENFRGRMRFIAANDDKIRPNQRPPFGVCLAIFDRSLYHDYLRASLLLVDGSARRGLSPGIYGNWKEIRDTIDGRLPK